MDSQDTDPFGPSPSLPFPPFMGDEEERDKEERAEQFASVLGEIENSTPYKRMLASTAGLDVPDMDVGTDLADNTEGSEDETSPESDSDKTVMPDILEDGYGVMSVERPTRGSRAPPPKFGPLAASSSAPPPKFGLLPMSSSAPILGRQFTQDDQKASKLGIDNQTSESPLQPLSKLYGPVLGYNYGDMSSSAMDPFTSPSPAERFQRGTQQHSVSSFASFPSKLAAGQPTHQLSIGASGLTSPSALRSERKILTSAGDRSKAYKAQPSHPQIKMSYDWPNSIPHVGNYKEDPFTVQKSSLPPTTPTRTPTSSTTPKPKPKVQTGTRSFSQPLPQTSTPEQAPKAKSRVRDTTTTPGTTPTCTQPVPKSSLSTHMLQTPENHEHLALRDAARAHWIQQNHALIAATLRAHELARALFDRMPTDANFETWQAARRDAKYAMDLNRLSESRRALFMPAGMRPLRTTDVGAFGKLPGASLREESGDVGSSGGHDQAQAQAQAQAQQRIGINAPGRERGVLLGGEMALMERVCTEAMNRRWTDYDRIQGAAGPGAENLDRGEKKDVRRFFAQELETGTQRRQMAKVGGEGKVLPLVGVGGEIVRVKMGTQGVAVRET